MLKESGNDDRDGPVIVIDRDVHLTVRIWQLVPETNCRIVVDGGSMEILSDDEGYRGYANLWIRRFCDCLTVDFMNFSGSIACLNIIPDEGRDVYLKIILKKVSVVYAEYNKYTNRTFVSACVVKSNSDDRIFYIQIHGRAFSFSSADEDERSYSRTLIPDARESVTLA